MSTGSIRLDMLLNQIQEASITGSDAAVPAIMRQFPEISMKEAAEIQKLIISASDSNKVDTRLVVTAPPSFKIKTKSTMITVKEMLEQARSSILITGYSLSDYFSEMTDCIIEKSQKGVFVKFFVNDIEKQSTFDKLCRYKGSFLKIYNFPKSEDRMAALHAKVISTDGRKTLISSANLSYHGMEGNIELGTLIDSEEIAKQVNDIFTQLIFSRVFEEV